MRVGTSCCITITEEKVKQYAFLSGDFNEIHLNHEAAERCGFKAPIAHGMLTMGLALEIAASFTGEGMRVSAYEMQFLKPVFQNDTIHLVAEEIKLENDMTKLVIVGKNKNEVVVKGKVTLL
jgi:3-hydroxybutyryl-CoA dehydratase